MAAYFKNMQQSEVVSLAAQVSYLPGQIVSKTLSQNAHHSMTLFAFDAGEEISTHASEGDAMVTILDGTGKITIEQDVYLLHSGETIIMPAGKPHAVNAETPFKMSLLVLFD